MEPDGWLRWGCGVLMIGLLLLSGCEDRPMSAPPEPLPALDPTQIARGRQIYRAACAECHGAEAEGAPNWQQPDSQGNLPAPPHDDTGHTWRHSDAQLAEIIREGWRDPFNQTPDLTMPPFRDRLSDDEIAAVLTYFKNLWSAEHRRFQEEQNRDTGTRD